MPKFAKGTSGNPGGRPKVPIDIQKAKSLTRHEFDRVATKLLACPANELADRLSSPDCTVVERMLGEVMQRCIQRGDATCLVTICDRLFGKPQQQVQISEFEPTIIRRMNGEEIELGRRIVCEENEH